MARSKQVKETPRSIRENIGLLAIGSSAPWEVAIDVTTSGTERWFAQIEGPSISLYFEIPSPEIVAKIAQFFEGNQPKGSSNNSAGLNGSLVIAGDKQNPVMIIRDDEFRDRYFFIVGTPHKSLVRYTIAGTDLKDLAKSFREADEDLNEDE